jgi:competence protein ComFC
MARSIFLLIKDLIFPKQCFNCKAWGNFMCAECRLLIPTVEHQRCIECQKPSLLGLTHPKCKTKYLPDRLITVFNYQHPLIQQMINTGKLSMIPEIFIDLANTALSKLEPTEKLNEFVLCPIPLSKFKQNFRGFNQSLIIAKIFSKQYNLPNDALLIKNNFIKQQKQLDKQGRLENMQSAFKLTCDQALPRVVILIDDVTTTGATFKSAAKILKQAGIQKVWCFALAQD